MEAATPAPMNKSELNCSLIYRFNKAPIVVPKCTNGQYWPTLAPPLAEIKAANVLSIPAFISVASDDL